MNIRQSLKICRELYGDELHFTRRRYKVSTIIEARKVADRKWLDRRFPYVPSDEELGRQADMFVGIFAGLAKQCGVDLPEELDAIAFDFGEAKLQKELVI